MSVAQDAIMTVHCPSCDAPMHLPNRDFLGRKARCWQCGNKSILSEPDSEPSQKARGRFRSDPGQGLDARRSPPGRFRF